MEINNLKEFIINNEKIFEGKNHEIKYLYQENPEAECLVIVLSGFHGKERVGKAPVYNYIRTLSETNANKLFILDGIDNVPVYYYGINKQPTYLNDVADLVRMIGTQSKINLRRTIVAGSSKGGTGALLLGLKMGIGHIISGSNQLYVGTYLNRFKSLRTMMVKMLGEYNENSKDDMDEIFKSHLLVTSTRSNLYFHGGNSEGHYLTHMKPLLRHYDKQGIKYELDLRHYSGHNNVSIFFPKYLKRKIEEIMDLPKILPPNVEIMTKKIILNFNTSIGDSKTLFTRVYIYLHSGDVVYGKYQKGNTQSFNIDPDSIKSIKIYLKQFDKLRNVRIFSLKSLRRDNESKDVK